MSIFDMYQLMGKDKFNEKAIQKLALLFKVGKEDIKIISAAYTGIIFAIYHREEGVLKKYTVNSNGVYCNNIYPDTIRTKNDVPAILSNDIMQFLCH